MSEETVATESPAPSTENKGWFKRLALWKKIVAAVVLLIVVIVVVANMATSAPAKVSNEYLNDIQAGNATAAYALMSTEAKAVVSESDFKAVVEQIGPILNTKEKMTSKEVHGETGTAATAKVTYEIKGTDGVTYNFTVNLVKDNGQWRVLNFDSKKQ